MQTDRNDAKVIAEFELTRTKNPGNYILISAEESVVRTVQERRGDAIQF